MIVVIQSRFGRLDCGGRAPDVLQAWRKGTLGWGLAFVVVAAAMLWPAALNGRPAYFFDSEGYYSNGRASVFAVKTKVQRFLEHSKATHVGAAHSKSAKDVVATRAVAYAAFAYMTSWPAGRMVLTIIVQASSRVPLKVTGNTGRLAMRQSKSKVANALLERLAQPLIATSANLSGQPTCTSGIEVFGAMDGRVDLVLDAGPATGLGATTVDITEPYWRVIKEGVIPESSIAEVLKGS